MNGVQTVTQKHYRVEKPGQKPSQVHEHQKWPSWHAQVRTGAPRRAYGPARAVVSWSGPSRVVARDRSYRGRLNAVSWRVRVLLCALCCASCSPGTLYCDTVAQPPSHFGHNNTLCVLRYKRPAFKPASVTIHLSVLRYNLFLQYTSYNTKPLKTTLPVAIHYSVLQYTLLTAHPRPPGHNTLTAL